MGNPQGGRKKETETKSQTTDKARNKMNNKVLTNQ